jgi:chromosome segregation ATPase
LTASQRYKTNKFMKFEIGLQRNDPPLAPDEIQIGEALPAVAPQRVKRPDAVSALRIAAERESEFAAEMATRQAEILAEKSAAAALQAEYESMIAADIALRDRLANAENQFRIIEARLAEIERWCSENWEKGIADHELEFSRLNFLAARLPGWIQRMKSDRESLGARLAEFRKTHGIGE